MRYGAWCCIFVGTLAGLTGCGWLSGSGHSHQSGGVAVVDLDEVAKSLGVDSRLSDMIATRKAVLANDLGKIQTELKTDLQTELDDVKTTFGDEVPADKAARASQEDARSKRRGPAGDQQRQFEAERLRRTVEATVPHRSSPDCPGDRDEEGLQRRDSEKRRAAALRFAGQRHHRRSDSGDAGSQSHDGSGETCRGIEAGDGSRRQAAQTDRRGASWREAAAQTRRIAGIDVRERKKLRGQFGRGVFLGSYP